MIDECALTGESVPVVKKAIEFSNYLRNGMEIEKSSIIFEGTTNLQVDRKTKMVKFEQYKKEFGIPVCVIRTNFSTTKGQLIRLISFPR